MAFDIKLVKGRLPGFTSLWNTLESPLFSPNKLCDCMGCGPCEPERTATAFYLEALCSQTGLSIHNSDPIRVISPTGEKPMFANFKTDSLKVVSVPKFSFELIVHHKVRAITITKEHIRDLGREQTFAIERDDAIILCKVISIYSSTVADDAFIIKFELMKEETD